MDKPGFAPTRSGFPEADILCQNLHRRLTGGQPSDAYFRDLSKLADMVVAGRFKQLDGTAGSAILRTR